MAKSISIITPTYNRAYILEKLYLSLVHQTSLCFEWIIIDDGSSDDTQEMVDGWMGSKGSNLFPIIYKKVINGGKHRAINYAMQFVKYSYVFIVDSDDRLVPDAVEQIQTWIDSIEKVEATNLKYAGVSGFRMKSDGSLVGRKVDWEFMDASNNERRKFNLLGDKAEVYKTELLRQYPFPEFDGENFLPENAVWDAIALAGYKIRWFNRAIYVSDYLEDGLTASYEKKIIDNFKGYTYSIKMLLKVTSFPLDIYILGAFLRKARYKGLRPKNITNDLEISSFKFVLGLLASIYHDLRRKRYG